MGYRKLSGDYLFDGIGMMGSDAVLITREDGTIKDVVSRENAGDGIEKLPGMITPGFVNTHCHLELSHMKGIVAPGSGLVTFLTNVIRQRNVDPAEIMAAATRAEQEMYENGTVAVADICNTTDSIAIKQSSRIYWQNFIEVIGFNESIAEARMAQANAVLDEFNRLLPSWLNSVVPHAPYSVSAKLFALIDEEAAHKIISIHNQESQAENDLFETGVSDFFRLYENLNIDPGSFTPSGRSSVLTYMPLLQRVFSILLVHNTFLQEADIVKLLSDPDSRPRQYFCICINANRYIESANPPLQMIRRHDGTITLGTDSLASNQQLSILEEMKTIHREFPDISLAEMLYWATINGAMALNRQDQFGAFIRGKRPGIVLIEGLQDGELTASSTARRFL